MARTTGPLMSLDASGSVASTITFAKWKGRNYVRQTVTPSNPQSPLQMAVRAVMRFLTQAWATIGPSPQTAWEAAAKVTNITGLNQMVKDNQKVARQNLGIFNTTPQPSPVVPTDASGFTALGGFKQIKLDWTDSVTATAWCYFVYSQVGGAPTQSFDKLIQVVPKGKITFTDTGLTTGDVVHYLLIACDESGSFSTPGVTASAPVG